jgi:clan AA aspartic protease (TIGR02281 family)
MALARAYGMLKHFTLMEDTLANFPSDDIRSVRLRNNVNARLNGSLKEDTVVSLTEGLSELSDNNKRRPDLLLRKVRGHFIAPASVNNIALRLLVDTGASTTAISDIKFNGIDADELTFLGLFTVNTAGGSIQAPIYKVKRLTLGKKTLENTSVLVLPSENLGQYDGLLGMNVLSRFDVVYDANSDRMRMFMRK